MTAPGYLETVGQDEAECATESECPPWGNLRQEVMFLSLLDRWGRRDFEEEATDQGPMPEWTGWGWQVGGGEKHFLAPRAGS